MKGKLLMVAFLLTSFLLSAQKKYNCLSPDGSLKLEITVGDDIRWALDKNGTRLIAPSQVALQLQNGKTLGVKSQKVSVRKSQNRSNIAALVYKKKTVEDNFNSIELSSKDGYQLTFRLYNDACAYRWETLLPNEIVVENEIAQFNTTNVENSYIQWVRAADTTRNETQFFQSFENLYEKRAGFEWSSPRLAASPLLVQTDNEVQICIFDADVRDYPGMFLQKKTADDAFNAVFATYPAKTEQGGHNRLQLLVKERENYIAKTTGTRSFPWRAIAVTDYKDLLNNDLAFRLSAPQSDGDFSWVKPGKVAWDWWNDWNISGVDFVSGVNNDTYKYYIDFASANHIEYVILDEGWAVNKQADMMQVVPEIDIKLLCDYARQKNVGIILWGGMYAMERDMEGICKHYSEMGVKGFKVDFMDRDDQWMMNFTWRLAQIAAKYKLMIDYHGVFKPNGLQRTYPNVVSFEAVYGLEQMKWDSDRTDMVTHDVTLPFIRMVAGPMDYTPGAMRNAARGNYRPVYNEPMSQGTRCRQLAEYIVFESPLSMLCDNPSNYMKEPECTHFIADVPTVWDESVALDGRVAEYAAVARKKGDVWYIGGINNWTKRSLTLDLSFLPAGKYKVELFSDGVNARRVASDYKRTFQVLDGKTLTINMAPGGGFAGRVVIE